MQLHQSQLHVSDNMHVTCMVQYAWSYSCMQVADNMHVTYMNGPGYMHVACMFQTPCMLHACYMHGPNMHGPETCMLHATFMHVIGNMHVTCM